MIDIGRQLNLFIFLYNIIIDQIQHLEKVLINGMIHLP